MLESKKRFEGFVHGLPDGVIVYSDDQILFANDAAMKLLGARDRRDVEGKPILLFIQEEELQSVTNDRADQELPQGTASKPAYRQLIRCDGESLTADICSMAIEYDGSHAIQLIIRDLSPWIHVEEKLSEKDDLYKTLVESVMAGVFVEQNQAIVYANPYLLNMFGYRMEELSHMKLSDFVDEEELVVFDHREFFLNGTDRRPFPFKVKGRRKDGAVIHMEGNCSSIMFNGEQALLGTIQEVTQKHEKEMLLLQNAKLYQRMLRYIPEPIFITYAGQVLYVNRNAMDMLGISDELRMIGRNLYDFVHESDREMVKAEINRTYTTDEPSFFKEARMVWNGELLMEVEGSNVRIDHYMGKSVVLSVIRDLTDRKRAEERLLRSEKLSVIGQLAAGVAHEIRNPLTALKGFTQLLRARYRDESAYFDIMADELDRINLIVNEFMTLANPHWTPYRHCDVEGIIQSVLSVLDTQAILLDVEIDCQLANGLPAIYCNENQLKQVFLNVIKNAIEAMPDGGRVVIMAREVAYIVGPQLQICIQDEGSGMPEELIRRLGEPFVTTKEKGTGLGLMVCTRIIEAHQGTLHIRRGRERGTIVEITLPLLSHAEAVPADGASDTAPA